MKYSKICQHLILLLIYKLTMSNSFVGISSLTGFSKVAMYVTGVTGFM